MDQSKSSGVVISAHNTSRMLLLAALGLAGQSAVGQVVFLNSFGGPGSGAGQFSQPTSVAIGGGGSGNIYVADALNNRIQIFSPTGSFISSFGTTGTSGGQFQTPEGVAVSPNGGVYVTDTGNNRVEVFNSAGTFETGFGSLGTGAGQYRSPFGVAVNSSGGLYVAESIGNRVNILSSSGTFQSSFGSAGSGSGQFNIPQGVAVQNFGTVAVADFNNNRVQLFTPTGGYVGSVGSSGSGNGQLSGPVGVAYSQTSNLYVADSNNSRVEVFSPSGGYLSSIGSFGNGNGQLSDPAGVAVNNSGIVYVTDVATNRISRYFDPSSFNSGTVNFTDPSVGPIGYALTTALSLTSQMGFNLGGGLNISGGTFTENGGGLSAVNLIVSNNGVFNYNSGSHSLSFGFLLSGTMSGLPYTINSDEDIQQQGGTISFAATNISGKLDYISGALTSPIINVNSGGLFNVAGPLTLSANQNLALAGGTVYENAALTNNGIVSGSGLFTGNLINAASGRIQMVGSSSLNFEGGLINNGQIQVSNNADASITGTLTNNSGSKVTIAGNSVATFWNNVTNGLGSQFQVSAGSTAVFFGNVTGLNEITGSGTTDFEGGTTPQALTATGTAIVGGPFTATLIRDNTLMVNSTATITAKSLPNNAGGTSVVNKLSFSNGGRLDLTNNSMVIDYTGPVGTLVNDTRSELQTGSLTSSSADSTHRLGYGDNALLGMTAFAGQTVDSTSVLIKYTYAGDANLDGKVDIADLGALATNYGKTGVWTGGDFDYDGTINIADLGLLATNYGAGATSPLGLSFEQALAEVQAQTGVQLPEPGVLSVTALLALVRVRRRERLCV